MNARWNVVLLLGLGATLWAQATWGRSPDCGTPSAGELLYNGSFAEFTPGSGPCGWLGASPNLCGPTDLQCVADLPGSPGNKALRLYTASGAQAVVWQLQSGTHPPLLESSAGLRANTVYTLSFRALSTAGPAPIVTPELFYRTSSGGYGFVWLRRDVILDRPGLAKYLFEFRTMPGVNLTGALVAELKLHFTLGAGATTWIDDISLETSALRVLSPAPATLSIGSFEWSDDEDWQEGREGESEPDCGRQASRESQCGASGLALKLTAPPDGGTFAERDVPLDLDIDGTNDDSFDMRLRVCTDHPERVGRMYVSVRDDAGTVAWSSFGGIRASACGASQWCSTFVVRKEEFFTPIGHGRIDWSTIESVGIKLESNSNGGADVEPAYSAPSGSCGAPQRQYGDPAGHVTVWVDSWEVHPKTTTSPSAIDGERGPTITNVQVRGVSSTAATVSWRTDEGASGSVDYGSTTAYELGSVAATCAAGLCTTPPLSLAAGHKFHVRVRSTRNGEASFSGDVGFETEPSPPWFPPAPTAYFPIALGGVAEPEWVPDAKQAGFNTVQTTLYGACDPGFIAPFAGFVDAYLGTAAQPPSAKVLLTPVCVNFTYDGDANDPLAAPRGCFYDDTGVTCDATATCVVPPGGWIDRFAPSNACLTTQVQDRIDSVLAADATHGSLLGYYMYDEPEINGYAFKDRLEAISDRIRALDPIHKVFAGTTFIQGNAYVAGNPPAQPEAIDLPMFDPYPIPGPVDAIVGPIQTARAAAMAESKAFHTVFQAYSKETDRNWPLLKGGAGVTRYPSRDEMRAMAYLGIVHDAAGVWAHAYTEIVQTRDDDPPRPVQAQPATEWVWASLASVARELRRIEPVLASTVAPLVSVQSPVGGPVHTTVRGYSGNSYLIAVNSDPTSRPVTFELAGLVGAVRVLDGSSTPSSTGPCTLQDTLPGYGARVYEIGPAPDLDADGIGDACDNCAIAANPDQGPAVFGQPIEARDVASFGWATPLDVVYVRGDLALVSSYAIDVTGVLPGATLLTDSSTPAPGAGFYYLTRPDCAVGSWQNSSGAEPGRDAALP